MSDFLGLNVVAIDAPQDRTTLELHVVTEQNQLGIVRFSNDDGAPIEVEFSHISVRLISEAYISLGEFEELNEIESGYEIIGDFGIILVKCKKCTYSVKSS